MIAFEVNDMTCGHCAGTIAKALNGMDAEAKVFIVDREFSKLSSIVEDEDPPDAQEIIRQRLADILVATVSLRLVKDRAGENVLPVVEIMRATTTIQACIREGRLDEIEKHIENGASQYQMQTLDMHLLQLYRQDLINIEDAKRLTHSMDFERKLMFDN